MQIYSKYTANMKLSWTIVRFSSKGTRPDAAGPRSRCRRPLADTGARLGGYPAPSVEGDGREKSVAGCGRGDLLPAAGAVPRLGRAGFSLRFGRKPSGCSEKRSVPVGHASAIDRGTDWR